MTKPLPIFLLASCLLSSCARDDDSEALYSYSKNVVKGWPVGRSLDPNDVSRVRYPEGVHAYHVGRLPSKDRRSMSEAHTVYRVERSAKWDQRLPATPMRSRGPVLGIREPSSRPIPVTEAIRSEQERQRKLSQQIAGTQERMVTLEGQLEKKLLQYSDSTKMVKDMQVELEKMAAEVQIKEAELARSQANLKDAESRIELLEMTQPDTGIDQEVQDAPPIEYAPVTPDR